MSFKVLENDRIFTKIIVPKVAPDYDKHTNTKRNRKVNKN